MTRKRYLSKILLPIVLVLSFTTNSCAQLSTEKRVDSLFAKWDRPNKPGYAVGIVHDHELVFAKGYGMANLEYKIPISPDSPFYIGSMSKQFTAACLLLLQEQGILDFSDPVGKYLPEFPTYEKTITIEHLLHHTSGIRESYSLMLFAGGNLRWEDYFDNDDMCRLMFDQRSLNFIPGEKYNYSSGGYILLAKIVERISGESLREFAEKNIFSPLDMSNTFFNDNYAEIIPQRVESYRRTGNNYERYNKNFDTYGDGGIITTLKDLAKWDKAFYEDKLGIKDFSQKMYSQGVLSNGKTIDYAMAVQIREYNGRKIVEHNGGMLGFIVDMVRFPDQKFTAIVMSNGGDVFPTFLAYQLSDIYLGKSSVTKNGNHRIYSTSPGEISADILKKYSGHYWNVEQNYYNTIDFKNDSLFFNNTNGNVTPLMKIGKDSFAMADTAIKIKFYGKNNKSYMRRYNTNANNEVEVFRKYNPELPGRALDLKRYVGSYYSDELKTTYQFSLKDDNFYWKINHDKERQLYPASGNIVWNSDSMVWTGFAEIMFQINTQGKVTGLLIGDSRVRGVMFKKE